MAFQSESPLDATDWRIIRELQQDARLSYNELGRRVALSAPATAERIRKLEDRGIIIGYSAQIDSTKVGFPLLAFLQMRCNPEKCLLKTSSAEEFPEIMEIHKLSGSHCTILKVSLASMQHLEALNERLGKHGPVVCNIVTSTAMSNRMVDWENFDADFPPPADAGWAK